MDMVVEWLRCFAVAPAVWDWVQLWTCAEACPVQIYPQAGIWSFKLRSQKQPDMMLVIFLSCVPLAEEGDVSWLCYPNGLLVLGGPRVSI